TALFAARASNAVPPAPVPPWRRNADFWLIPAVQVAALLAIAAAVAVFVSRAFLRPLAAMIDGMRQIESGNLDIRLPTSRVVEVAEVAAAFGAMADALRGSLERQDELEQERRMTISAVIHDLRTPLFALRGYLEGLAAGIADSPEKAARYLQLSRDKADALDRLVTDLFAYARTEYLEEAPRRERLDLSDLLTRTVEGMQPRADAKGVRLRLTGADAPCWAAGDPHLLTRAVENLLDNAVRYTPPAGEIAVDCECAGDDVRFSVRDDGPGIPPADLPHIFTPLYRGESSRNRRTGGAGLGLAIARRLLRAHGGDLTAANAASGGALFQARLPGLAGPLAETVSPPTAVVAPALG
ncbi:MAG TPA: HAMP domain-containing sensor histidine kinase, partial [Thermomicrobiales bacterium]|nr:HAMP domain-containing sensor histidine kinase [Thermomicrobiales bacterium]